jgi:rod shape-determining protein MreC
MKTLLRFFKKHRNAILFVTLELMSLWLIFSQPSAKFIKQIDSSHPWISHFYVYINDLKNYPSIKQAYRSLLEENSLLRTRLLQNEQELASREPPALALATPYQVIPARVINNSVIHAKNYLTIDQGAQQGILPGMGVISNQGIVGRIKAVSEQFATITSLLHIDMFVSAKVGNSGIIATVRWLGDHPRTAQLLYVPKHVSIAPGDLVVTSGYNATFYEGILIGQVKQVELKKGALFYSITVELSTDFSSLQYVYVIKNKLQQEKETLENLTKNYYE